MNEIVPQIGSWLGLHLRPQDLGYSHIALRSVVVAFAALVMLRVSKKHFFARRNAIDVMLTFVLASTLARAINGSAAFFPTIASGFLLVFLHRGLSRLAANSSLIARIAKGSPDVLIDDGKVREDAMRHHAMSREDLDEDLRINGTPDPRKIRCAMIERNGTISVEKKKEIYTIAVENGVQTVRIEV
jgi:uncharacterized membrane protein YcaP (DUF421 family)